MKNEGTILYIRIPRTGGTSISLAASGSSRLVSFKHEPLSSILLRRPDLAVAWVFTVVRNPFDWLVSVYHHLRENPQRDARGVVEGKDFRQYAEWATSGDAPLIVDDEPSYKRSYASPQVEWVRLYREEPALTVNSLGRFETIERDAGELLAELGLPRALEKTNGSKRGPYREYYDRALRERVARFYTEDLDRFGYSFGGSP